MLRIDVFRGIEDVVHESVHGLAGTADLGDGDIAALVIALDDGADAEDVADSLHGGFDASADAKVFECVHVKFKIGVVQLLREAA